MEIGIAFANLLVTVITNNHRQYLDHEITMPPTDDSSIHSPAARLAFPVTKNEDQGGNCLDVDGGSKTQHK